MSDLVQVISDQAVIYKRDRSSVWQCRYKGKDKKWHRTSTGEKDQKAATAAALRLYYEAEVKRENKLPVNTKRFDSVAKSVVQRMEEELKAGEGKAVYNSYIGAINSHLIPFFGKHNIDSITAGLLAKFDAHRTKTLGRVPAASTITNHNSALNKVFDFAEIHGWITPAVRPSLKNKGKKTQARPAFTMEEYRTLIRKLPAWSSKGRTAKTKMMRELLRDYVLVLANTGIRHGTEALGLKWRHIDWHKRGDERWLRLTVDGKTGERSAIARHNTEDFLRRVQLRFAEIKDMTFDELIDKKVDEFVFRLSDGTRTESLNQTFDKLMDDTGLAVGAASETRRTLYSFRHTYATFQLLDGVGIHDLARQMGTSVAMLEQHYSKITPELLADTFAGSRMGRNLTRGRA